MTALSSALLAAVALLAGIGYSTGRVTADGALAGAAVGVLTVLGFSWPGFLLLILYFPVLSGAATVFRYEDKRERGLLDESGGRDALQALANGGVPALVALLAVLGVIDESTGLTLFTTGLALSVADTVSAEVGKAFAGPTRLVTDLREVEPGTDGGVSLEGTLAGVLAAAVMIGAGYALSTSGAAGLVVTPVIIGSLVGNYSDSLLGATFQSELEQFIPTKLANDLINLVASILGTLGACLFLIVF